MKIPLYFHRQQSPRRQQLVKQLSRRMVQRTMLRNNNSTDITPLLLLLFYLKPHTLYVYIYSVRRSCVWFLLVGNINFTTVATGLVCVRL